MRDGATLQVQEGVPFNVTLSLSSPDGNNGFRLSGRPGEQSRVSVSAAGDINGDGFGDILIGAWHNRTLSFYAGAAYVVFGSAEKSGASYLVFGIDAAFTALLQLSALNGANGFELAGGAGTDTLCGGAGNDLLDGGEDADRLEGEDGADTLDGGLGQDILIGGGDFDVFLFNDPLHGTNIDTIMDFGGAGDLIQIDNSVFNALTSGNLMAAAFEAGPALTAATTAEGRIVYDTVGGGLFYDPDGAGNAPALQFAILATRIDGMTAEDFFVI